MVFDKRVSTLQVRLPSALLGSHYDGLLGGSSNVAMKLCERKSKAIPFCDVSVNESRTSVFHGPWRPWAYFSIHVELEGVGLGHYAFHPKGWSVQTKA